jgi:Tfp pilus assembly protein PilF
VEDLFRRAVALRPQDADVSHWYGMFLASTGRVDEALRQLARVRELDPAFPKTYVVEAAIAQHEERHADAIASLRRANELSPATPKYVASLAQAYVRAGQPAEAQRTLSELRGLADRVHVEAELLQEIERQVNGALAHRAGRDVGT